MKNFMIKAGTTLALAAGIFWFGSTRDTPEEKAAKEAQDRHEKILEAQRLRIGQVAADYFFAVGDSLYNADTNGEKKLNPAAMPKLVNDLSSRFSTAAVSVSGKMEINDNYNQKLRVAVTATDSLGKKSSFLNGELVPE